MMKLQFDINKTNYLKDILYELSHDNSQESIQHELEERFADVDNVDFLLTVQEQFHADEAITIEAVQNLFKLRPTLSGNSFVEREDHPGHPIQIFYREVKTFQTTLKRMNVLLKELKQEESTQESDTVSELKRLAFGLGELHKHFHRKEKLFFPLMERYGHYSSIRSSWRSDDVIRALYQGIKRQINGLPEIEFDHVQITYDRFEQEFNDMLFQEETITLPVLASIFDEDDWMRIAKESDAFGFVTTESEAEWEISAYCEAFIVGKEDNIDFGKTAVDEESTKNVPFGGGYLTTEEANLILNNLPLEITFVDKNSMFKYFNEMTEPSDMMLVRTPISIGRNVANCHPPKSLSKVMSLVRDLKAKRRESENMWFKKKDEYIHITYKGLFNDKDEFVGILEYVQDIQPFFNLPSDVKRVLSEIDK